MNRGMAVTVLCFVAIVAGWEVLVSVADVPRTVGPMLGIGAALWVSGMVMRSARTPPRRPRRPPSRAAFTQELRTGR